MLDFRPVYKRSTSQRRPRAHRKSRASEKKDGEETDVVITEGDQGTDIDAVKHQVSGSSSSTRSHEVVPAEVASSAATVIAVVAVVEL